MSLPIPEKTLREILRQHLVVLGKTGAGKSSALRVLVEYLLSAGKRVCIVDPKGDWWGLKASADGKGAGHAVIAFGDFKNAEAQDVPINERSGKHVAELIANGNRPAIIGFRGWMPGAMSAFWIDFASTLFNANSGELYLVGDEFHNFAPKGKVLDPQAGKCLHWSNRIMSEGRGVGLICLIASQRPQKVHNDALTCCETLVAMRVIHEADRNAVREWVDGCGNREQGNAVLKELANMARGEAFVWSPEAGFGPERITFPMFATFDSFAPPQLQKKVVASGWADVDLASVKEKLASVIEEHRANDPAELKATIAKLKTELNRRGAESQSKIEIKEVSLVTKEDHARLNSLIDQVEDTSAACRAIEQRLRELYSGVNAMRSDIGKIDVVISQRSKFVPPATNPKPVSKVGHVLKNADTPAGNGHLDGEKQKILDTVAMLRVRGLVPNREMIARWLDIHPNGGRYGSNLAYLREHGYLAGCELTERGDKQAASVPTGVDSAREVLDGSQREIFDKLLDEGRSVVHSRESLAEALGIHPNGGRYGSNLARLRTMGLIPERGEIKLTEAAYA